ncbi:MAG: T9SS type A sorting domain-containing protein [Flavobacterium sp. JAD_PAG50586_2]|nr:MAG: T9SS type A sorting domain-containing protein [Flavobacterium sp. JAD_PAG50586_2]
MKKFYSLIIILIGFVANAQVINIPDANFKAKLLAADSSNNIASTGFPAVPTKIDSNNNGEIEQSEALLIVGLRIDGSNISDLTGLEYFHNLDGLVASNNPLTTFSQNGMPNLHDLILENGNLTSIDFSGYTSLWQLHIVNNSLTSLSLSSFTHLSYLDCANNNLTTIDITGCSELTGIILSNNQLTTITFPTLTNFDLGIPIDLDNNLFETITAPNIRVGLFHCSNNPNLRYLNLKESTHVEFGSGSGDYFTNTYFFTNCPQLEYVCVREEDLADTQAYISSYPNCHVNTYCSFTPGGTFYTLEGMNRFDANTNGCDSADGQIPNMIYTISNGLLSTTLVADNNGSYHYDVQAGTYIITPIFEIGSNFTASPASATVTFPSAGDSFTQNFCTTANSLQNDLEITVYPLDAARPGFDASYKIIYKNKGATVQNGMVSLEYFDPIEDLISANPSFTSESSNFMHTLNWVFSNLLPFETREITLTFNLNSPLEDTALNAGNIIQYTATITGMVDETPTDNTSLLNQVIVNSFDPNDKTCIEGANLPVYEVGKYLHYIIRFENTGTANAENVVVKDMIDTTKFDISTLVPLHGSHPFETRISSTNKVEFIFENIDLPFDNANNDGYAAFKIKTLPTLIEGDAIVNSASIYFDYNAPIITDPYTVAVFNPLSTSDFDFRSVFSLSPVPAKDNLTITAKQNVVISSVTIYNSLGQLVQINTNPSETIDVSGLKTGSYFIKIISDKGTASSKFVKE